MPDDDNSELLKAWQWRGLTPEERFRRSFTVEENGCWIWRMHLSQDGYGRIQFNKRPLGAHRLSYLFHFGEIPEGCEIDHLCKNRACVNPSHLEAVPHRENVLRGLSAGPRSECKRGHAMTGENLGINVRWQKRYCKTCRALSSHAYRRTRHG